MAAGGEERRGQRSCLSHSAVSADSLPLLCHRGAELGLGGRASQLGLTEAFPRRFCLCFGQTLALITACR